LKGIDSSSDEEDEKFSGMFDTHCHPHDDLQHLNKISKVQRIGKMVIMGVGVQDWDIVEKVYLDNPEKVIPAFGVHPWFAHLHYNSIPSWLPKLRTLLLKYPSSILGEIGLDKFAKTPETGKNEYQFQMEVLRVQIELAAELERPISVHCVRAFGPLFDFFKNLKNYPPAVVMHSYGGSTDIVNGLLKIAKYGKRFYFGFSHCINVSHESPKLLAVMKMIPRERILIESDQNTPLYLDEDILKMCQLVAKTREWTVEETIQITSQNAKSAFQEYLSFVKKGKPNLNSKEEKVEEKIDAKSL